MSDDSIIGTSDEEIVDEDGDDNKETVRFLSVAM